jgi:hypothetical protein
MVNAYRVRLIIRLEALISHCGDLRVDVRLRNFKALEPDTIKMG